jgi:hypothetical protein
MRIVKNYLVESGFVKSWNDFTREFEYRFFQSRFNNRLNRFPPVIVYQMGKVASASIYRSLGQIYPGVVLHTHTFGPNDSNWQIRRIYEHCVLESNPLKIISPIREPISRNLSAFFQNFERDTGVSFRNSKHSLPELQELFLNNYQHRIPLEWFDKNIKANFDIDVYAVPFPECGIATYQNNNIQLLIFRSELDDAIKNSAIQEFLGLPDFKMKARNIGATKSYASAYLQLSKSMILPVDYTNEMCSSKYFNHFYSKEFIEETRRKWSGG